MTEHRSEWINFEEEENKSQERIKAALDIKVTGASMTRLESISNNFSKSQFNDGFGLLSDDVEWMIERLERYEKILDECADLIVHAERIIQIDGTAMANKAWLKKYSRYQEAPKDEIT